MCVSCGCKNYEDDHGDKRNITMSGLRSAAEAGKVQLPDLARNIDEALQTSGSGSGQGGSGAVDTMSHGNTPTQ